MNSIITRDEYTLNSLAKTNHQFCVPLYQRLYSWEQIQVTQLLKDLYEAQKTNISKDYYIGNIVLSKNKDNGFDLIDGQQRMTTLWLIALVLSKMCTNNQWKGVLINTDSELRLQLSVREAENNYLKALLEKNLDDLSTKNTEVNRRVIDAINVIHKFFKDVKTEGNLHVFADFIFYHAKLVATVLPSNMDLNKYFEVMNNRGVQLEKHEILKAQLLSKASEMQSSMSLAWLAKAWDACAQMNQYVERSFTTKDKAKALDDIINKSSKELATIFDANGENVTAEHTTLLTETNLQTLTLPKPSSVKNTSDKNTNDKYRSVVQFPEFLLHTLKLFIKQKGSSDSVKIKDSNLLVEFAQLAPEDVEAFICFLLKTRVLFDNYVIKYREVDARDIRHDISELKQTEKDQQFEYPRRVSEAGETRNLSMLQGMLNVSTESEHWLTPLLAFLHSEPTANVKDVTVWLGHLDNVLAHTRLNGAGLLDTANQFIESPNNVHSQFFDLNQSEFYKKLNQGTHTPRYWFFRLDYLLWKSWFSGEVNKNECVLQKSWQEPAKDFQFRQNRSVEHVYPRNPEGDNTWDTVTLDRFGNLALISVESNSGYNNQTPVDKRSDFSAKVEKSKTIESLKLALIYSGSSESWIWSQSAAEAHQKICCDILITSLTKKDCD